MRPDPDGGGLSGATPASGARRTQAGECGLFRTALETSPNTEVSNRIHAGSTPRTLDPLRGASPSAWCDVNKATTQIRQSVRGDSVDARVRDALGGGRLRVMLIRLCAATLVLTLLTACSDDSGST